MAPLREKILLLLLYVVVYSIDILLVIREATSLYLVPFVVPVYRRRPAYYK